MGAVSAGLLAVCACALALFAALWLLLRDTSELDGAVAKRGAPPVASVREEGPTLRVERPEAAASEPASAPPVTAPQPPEGQEPAPTGVLRVEVVDRNGAALEGLSVFARRGAKERVEQHTDATGLARFEPLEASLWQVLVGDHERPLVAANSLELPAGQIEFLRVQVLQPLTELDVEVVDEAGRPAPGVAVRTRCDKGGVSRGVTDPSGRVRLRHVALGMVRVFANDERLGRGNRALEISEGERPSVVIALATRPTVR